MANSLSKAIKSFTVGNETASGRSVFLHGLFGRGKNFSAIAKALGEDSYSLMVDLPNHGESGWTESFDYNQMADLVADHLYDDFAADGPVDVIGHSMGGKIAMLIALRHPDLVRRLVVIDIAPVSTVSAGENFDHLFNSLKSLNLGEIKSRTEAQEILQHKIDDVGVRSFLLQNMKRTADGFVWEPNLEMLHANLGTIMEFPVVTQAAFLNDVLWIGGELSDYVTGESDEAMYALFPLTEKVIVAGAGHWVHSEKQAEVIKLLHDFLTAAD